MGVGSTVHLSANSNWHTHPLDLTWPWIGDAPEPKNFITASLACFLISCLTFLKDRPKLMPCQGKAASAELVVLIAGDGWPVKITSV